MESPDSSPEAAPAASGLTDPLEQQRRRFAVLSRDDTLRGPLILLAVGTVLVLFAAYAVTGRAIGMGVMFIALGVGTVVALLIDLIGLFVTASVLGTGFGTFRSAVVRLTAIIVFLQGLFWVVWLGFVTSSSVILLVGGVLVVAVIGFGLLMDFFSLSIFETIVCLFILACTEAGADALLDWLDRTGLIHLAF